MAHLGFNFASFTAERTVELVKSLSKGENLTLDRSLREIRAGTKYKFGHRNVQNDLPHISAHLSINRH